MITILPVAYSCQWCGGLLIIRVKRKIANGTYQVIDWCQECGRNARKTHIISHKQAGDIERLPLLSDYTLDMPPCDRCGSKDGVEWHHFGVRHVFGEHDADTWPGAYLCRDCHTIWHFTIANHYSQCEECRRLYAIVEEF